MVLGFFVPYDNTSIIFSLLGFIFTFCTSYSQMPAEQNYTPENDVHYLMPWVEQVDAEFQEAEYWDSY